MSMNRAKIIADPIPERYARGWHCLGSAQKYKDGKPHTVNAFGYRLVVFQTSDGALQVLDAAGRPIDVPWAAFDHFRA